MWDNLFFFFSSTVYLSVLLGCGSIMDIFETSEFYRDPGWIKENVYWLILNAKNSKNFEGGSWNGDSVALHCEHRLFSPGW